MATRLLYRVHSRWQNLMIAAGLVMILVTAVGLSASLSQWADSPWRIIVMWSSIVVATLGFGALTIRAFRIGVYAPGSGVICVRSLTVTRAFAVEAVERTCVYYGYSAHGGRFFAPGIYVRQESGGHRLVRLWWLAAVGECAAEQWEAKVKALIDGAQPVAEQ